MTFLTLRFSCQSFIINSVTSQGQWSPFFFFFYTDQRSWLSAFEKCNGKSQSPIDIVTRDVSYDPSLPDIKVQGYDLSGQSELTLQNNGHTCKLVGLFSSHLTTLKELCVTVEHINEKCVWLLFCPLVQLQLPNTMRIVEGFDQIYLAAQLHFHWGNTEVPGSEHTIDNVHFPAEVWTASSTVYNIQSQNIFLWIKDSWRRKKKNTMAVYTQLSSVYTHCVDLEGAQCYTYPVQYSTAT